MSEKKVLQPGPDHPITIEPSGQRVTVTYAGRTIAESDDALVLEEAGYPPVFYVPLVDVAHDALQPSSHQTYCPYKGDASYYSLTTGHQASGDRTTENAVWFYEHPYDAVAQIKDHVAFYADKVQIRAT